MPSRLLPPVMRPCTTRLAGLSPSASSEVASREAAGESRQHETRQQLIKATLPSASAAAADQDSEPQYYIVLTAWEEVETAPQGSREIADYDAGAPAQQQTGSTGTQITVTRLILAIYPVAAAPTPASGTQKTSSSKPVRPSARVYCERLAVLPALTHELQPQWRNHNVYNN